MATLNVNAVSTDTEPTHKNDPDAPDSVGQFYIDQSPLWLMIGTLLNGTLAMRKAGRMFLPKYPSEAADGYEIRLKASTLLNYFKRTVTGLTGKPFSQPIVVPEDYPAEMEDMLEDMDMQGNDLDAFARASFMSGLAKGMIHFLVDMPPADEKVKTLADQRAVGARPYVVAIDPASIIAAFSEYVDGVEVLTHVRIQETCIEREGYAEVKIERIRVLEPGKWQVFRKGKDNKFKLETEGTTSLDYIPLVTWYCEKEGFMRSRPPLLDLAFLNVAHWQSASDQRNVLAVSRFPILYAAGVDPDQKIEIGPNSYFALRDPTARMGYVEHGGAAIAAGRTDLEDLKSEMAMMGLQLLMPQQSGNQTATAKALDGAEANCGLQALVLGFQAALNTVLEYMADWAGVEDDMDDVTVNSDFGMSVDNAADLNILLQARANREISHQAFMTELLRRRILAPDFSIEDDQELIADERAEMPKEADGLPPRKGSRAKAGPNDESVDDQQSEDEPVADQYPTTTMSG